MEDLTCCCQHRTKVMIIYGEFMSGPSFFLYIYRVTLLPPLPSDMAAPPSAYKDRNFLAVIGDEVRQSTPALTFSNIYLRTP